MEPRGAVHQGPLPRIGGLREHHAVSERAVADMAPYMGPTAGVSNILENFLLYLALLHHLMY